MVLKFLKRVRNKGRRNFNIAECIVCGGSQFEQVRVLPDDLIAEWELSANEVDYINKQQGYTCRSCNSNLRSMTLAGAILDQFRYFDTYTYQWVWNMKVWLRMRIHNFGLWLDRHLPRRFNK